MQFQCPSAVGLGISISLACSLLYPLKNQIIQIVPALALTIFFFSTMHETNTLFVSRFIQWALFSHLLVSVAPFVSNRDLESFWIYNGTLFSRFTYAVVYSGVLCALTFIAFITITELFDFKSASGPYLTVWSFCCFVVSVMLFLPAIPKNISDIKENKDTLPRLENLTRFLLVPFVLVYLAILYLYALKILITWSLPNGVVGWLVCGFSTMGTLTWLLAYPIREEGNALVRFFYKYFFVIIIPLLVLLFVAFFLRIAEYGVTENRYFLGTLACWLTIVSCYFAIFQNSDIRFIPASLCLLVLFTAVGPQSAYSVSLRSQKGRLTDAIVKIGGIPQRSSMVNLDHEALHTISTTMDYLLDVHGADSVSDLFAHIPESKLKLEKAKSEYEEKLRGYPYNFLESFFATAGLRYTPYKRSSNSTGYHHNYRLVANRGAAFSHIQGYDYLWKGISGSKYGGQVTEQGTTVKWKIENKNLLLTINSDLIQINLEKTIEQLLKNPPTSYSIEPTNLPEEFRLLKSENENWKVKIEFTQIGVRDKDGAVSIENFFADIYLARKTP